LISSAATHGFLPLLARDESIRLQLAVGVAEHKRLFGRTPTGCWLPECAYRPGGPWGPPGAGRALRQTYRAGIDEHLVAAGYRYFFVDTHLVRAGAALGYPDVEDIPVAGERTPYVAYRVASSKRRANDLFALVRDPKASAQVWSRAQGYPGDEWYLEFHKIRWPDGLRLWRVTGSAVDLGGKQRYDPAAADAAARNHADHFAGVLHETAERVERSRTPRAPLPVVTAPFDAELFGHWWFEGVDFLAQATRSMLLAQASDWQFIISTAEAADYASQRFDEHCAQAEDLVRVLQSGTIDDATMHRVEALGAQDNLFPNVLRSIEEVVK